MRTFLLVLVLAAGAPFARAQSPVEALSACLADSTSGKDRKDLARWVFFAMAAHPEMKPFGSAAIAAASADTDRTLATLFTRLLAEQCPRQTQAAYKQGGSKAIEVAFQTLGQLAMQELMSNPEVGANMSRFEKLLDPAKLGKALNGN